MQTSRGLNLVVLFVLSWFLNTKQVYEHVNYLYYLIQV